MSRSNALSRGRTLWSNLVSVTSFMNLEGLWLATSELDSEEEMEIKILQVELVPPY
jgi:hypothetical protein